jgi:hypothetical protein
LQDGSDEDGMAKTYDKDGKITATKPYHYDAKMWDLINAEIAYNALSNINLHLGGRIKEMIHSGVFILQGRNDDYYSRMTPDKSTTIYFQVSSYIAYQNLYHEFGHLLDNAMGDKYSKALSTDPHYSKYGNTYYFGGDENKFIDPIETLIKAKVYDPHFSSEQLALQHVFDDDGKHSVEQWADMFANFIADNINKDSQGGIEMHDWVVTHLAS